MLAVTLTLASFLPAPIPQLRPAVDAYGDPLPTGAVARLGSVRWRCPDPPDHLIWSPDGKYLVSTHAGKSVMIWAYPAGVVLGRFTVLELLHHRRPKEPELFPPTLTPQQVRFAPDGKSMLVYGGQSQLYRVRVPDGAWERIDTGSHAGTAVAISADGRRLLMEFPDIRAGTEQWGELRVIDLDQPGLAGRLWHRQTLHLGFVGKDFGQAAFPSQITPDGRFVLASAVRGMDLQVAVIDLQSGRTWTSPVGRYQNACFTPDGAHVLTTGTDGRLVRWRLNRDASAGQSSAVLTPEAGTEAKNPNPLVFSADGRIAAEVPYATDDQHGTRWRTVKVLDLRTLRTVREWTFGTGDAQRRTTVKPRDGMPAAAIASDGRTIAISVSDSPRLQFFDLWSGEDRQRFAGHTAAVRTLRATASGRGLVSVAADQTGHRWDLGRLGATCATFGLGRVSTPLGLLKDDDLPPPVRARVAPGVKVIYDRDVNRLQGRLMGSEQVVWEEAVPALEKVRAADRPGSLPDATDPDGVLFAVAIGDAVAVRDPVAGETVMTYLMPGIRPTAVEFIPQTNLLAAGYDDGQILLWDLWPADLPRRPPTDAEIAGLWADLATGPRHALRARMVLLAYPESAARGLKAHVRGLTQPTELDIDQWLAQLSHKRYAVREKATRSLARHFDVSEKAVRDMLAATKAPEVEQRLRAVIAAAATPLGDGAVAQLVRVVGVLERIGTPEARELLFRVARGSGEPATQAIDALARLRDRKPATGTAGVKPMSDILGLGKAANPSKAATRWQP